MYQWTLRPGHFVFDCFSFQQKNMDSMTWVTFKDSNDSTDLEVTLGNELAAVRDGISESWHEVLQNNTLMKPRVGMMGIHLFLYITYENRVSIR